MQHIPHPTPFYNRPSTLQIGDADHLALKTGIITFSDFRQKNIAAGGEGAPLAVYGDKILYSSQTETRVLVNLGGIANFTFLPKNNTKNFEITTDTGPANTLIDQYCKNICTYHMTKGCHGATRKSKYHTT
ncbi:MAG: anhydro-N-acetylmuramic acid kinase [Saprospiraceae bacterium]|nr:anhydro-N-acetylmuramic acid kinase [Saprospiraceae bacterium]